MELFASISLLVLAFLVGASCLGQRASRVPWVVALGVAVAAFAVAAATLHRPPVAEALVEDRPIEAPTDGYATSSACWTCHPGQHASWDASYHSSMTQIATEESVLGDFDDRELEQGGLVFRLSRDDEGFWVEMPDVDRISGQARVKRKIELTTGSHHMQVYWYASGHTRALGLLPFVFDLRTQDWMPRSDAFIQPPTGMPQSELGRWNKICAECHVTLARLRPVRDTEMGGQDTHVAEFGIACESCHGPGQAHIEAHTDFRARMAARAGEEGVDDIVHPARLSKERSAEVCGQCHSAWVFASRGEIEQFSQHGFAYRPGDVLRTTRSILRGREEWNPPQIRRLLDRRPTLMQNTFWPDGAYRVAGREYNGLVDTPCFERGEMTCLSCHSMHQADDDLRPVELWADDQLGQGMRGNDACLQCHGEFSGPAELEAHTHHRADSRGSLCYDCHMPHTSYALLKAVRSHRLDSPDAAVTAFTGRPNACNQCHLDRTLGWTADWLSSWYGRPRPALPAADEQVAAVPLLALRGDAGQRALAAWALGWPVAHEVSGDDWQGPYLATLLTDPYPAVRNIAARSLVRFEGFEDFELKRLTAPGAKTLAVDRWNALWSQGDRDARAPLLIERDGARWDRISELLAERDYRPVVYAE